MSHKLRGHLGEVEDKVAAAVATGTENNVKDRMKQLVPTPETGNYMFK